MANTTIALRSSGTAAATPSLGVLANGELSINYADGIIYYKTASNTLGSIRTTQPAGLTTEIQFNDAGTFGSNSGLIFDKSTGYFKAPIIESTNNGNGTNFKIGDDAWIGDVNIANSIRLAGQQDVNNAYIIFGASDAKKLGRSGTGALTYEGNFVASGELSTLNSSGDEGGQINFGIPQTNTTLNAGVVVDVFRNNLRFYESGGTNRGVYIDLTTASAGVGTNLLSGGGAVTSVAGATGAVSNNQILAGILTVDGAGSGLDADLLDGLSSDSFANAAFANTDYTTISATAGVYGNASHVTVTTLTANGRVSSITNTAISFPVTSVAGTTGAISNNQILSGLLTVDGAGSGLDADLLDGQHASYYLNTSSTAQTKAGGSNALTVGGLSNTYYVQASASAYTAQPMATEIWHDLFAFCKAYTTTYETYDGTSWSSETLNKAIFAQTENSGVTVATGSPITAVRWSFSNVAWGGGNWLVIGHSWSSGTSNKTVLLETSADNVTWTTRHTSTYTNNSCSIFHYLDSYSGDTYMRLTITRNPSSTGDVRLNNIKLLTARPGDQGRGKEYHYPYSWDGNQNITTGNNLYVITTANVVWHAGNDGTGSGLDADLLDGQHATYYTNATNIIAGTLSSARLPTTGTAGTYGNTTYLPVITTDDYGRVSAVTNTAIAFPVNSVGGATGVVSNTQLLNSIISVDGAGSGLDADTLDTLHASSFANATFANTLFSSSGGSISGDVTVTGNLTIVGTTVYANTTNALIADNILTLNASIGQASSPTVNAGIEVDRGSSANVSLLWNETSDTWQYTNDGTSYYDIADSGRVNSVFDLANGTATVANTDYTTVSATAGTYGNASAIPVVTVEANGRVSSVTTQTFSAATVGDILALSIALG